MAMSLTVACSPVGVEFSRNTKGCENLGEGACVVDPTDPTYINYGYDYTSPSPSVDVLVVVDNSYSMRVEHERIADRFSSFLNVIDGLDWQIGITTMDISNDYRTYDEVQNSKSYSLSGYSYMKDYQDGRLVPFTLNGTSIGKVLKKSGSGYSKAQLQAAFEETIQFETDYFSKGDERGIFAASLAVNNNEESWIRSHAHLAILFVTDEDVRGWGTDASEQKEKKWPTENDIATNLLQTIESKFGAIKNTSVYPIIVQSTDASIPSIENGGTKSQSYVEQCLAAQLQQDQTDAKVGYMYEDLFEFFPGTTASICNTNYSSILSGIADVIDTQTRESVNLACVPVVDEATGRGFSIGSELPDGTNWSLDGATVTFEPALPPGFQVRLEYSCE